MFENHFWKAAAVAILALAFIGCNGPSTPGGGGEAHEQEPDELTASIVPYADTEGDGSPMEIGDRLVFSLAASEAVQTVLWTTDNPQVLAIEAYPTDGAGPATQISAARIRAQGVSDGSATLTALATAADGRTATASLEIEVAYRVYVVTLNFRDGSPNTTIRVREGATVDAPEQPARVFDYSVAGLFSVPIPDFVFGGWHLGDEAFDFDTPITANITLDARWIAPDPIDLGEQPGDTIAQRAFGYVDSSLAGTNFALVLDADVSVAGGDPETGTGGLGVWDGGNLSLHGAGGLVEIGLSSQGFLIQIGEGSTLTLSRNIALRGMAGNDVALVRVLNGATLVMRDGSAISGNTNTSQGVNQHGFNGNFGGGVFVAWGGYLYMEGGEIYGNTVAARGGGVQVNNATFTMTGGRIRDNNAVEGGGVFVSGADGGFLMSGGEITGNTVSYNTDVSLPGIGGGVNIGYTGTLTMEGGQVHDNNAAGNGGGVNIGYGGTLIMKDGHVGDNIADNGGGVSIGWNGALTMSGGEIRDNTVASRFSHVCDCCSTRQYVGGFGGGVTASGNSNFEMTGGTIRGNIAIGGAGVNISWGDRTVFTMEGGQIRDNIAEQNGGGVNVMGGDTGFVMSGGAIHGNIAMWGGGVNTGGIFKLSGDGEIYGNTARINGGGVSLWNGIFTMAGGVIRDNITTDEWGNGGGVSITQSDGIFIMTNGVIHGNTAATGGGVNTSGTFEMSNGEIHSNTAATGGGVNTGGVFKLSGDGEIHGNTAETSGGGVSLWNGIFTMAGGVIRDNITTDEWGNGGGVSITHSDSTFIMTDGVIHGNTAATGGGVNTRGTFEMSNGEIHSNTAIGEFASGGGVNVGSGGTFAMTNGAILDNTANNGGGVNVFTNGTFAMGGGEISGNAASRGGGVCVFANGIFRISSGIIHGSAATGGLANTATGPGESGAALFVMPDSIAQRGTFDNFPHDFTASPSGDLGTTSDTISVLDGLQQ